jgi:hypothetical protein
MTDDFRVCNTCHQSKPCTDFYQRTRKTSLLPTGTKFPQEPKARTRLEISPRCKICTLKSRPAYDNNKHKAYMKQRLAKDGQLYRKMTIRRHGLTEQEFNDMLLQQGNVCGICKGPPNGKDNVFHIDHDHNTGKVRGLLCSFCNLSLGFARDNIDVLQCMIKYLEVHNGRIGIC